ncbi:ATP-binding protein [Rufibacter roseus]|uniref:histidine kinase n=1 Tax=Rufibacter roseus TaxID=1567108 RepID=A0ABW2DG97_9BACT|nr:ATP-binding protein [Rufibacter roseus]
MSNTPSANSSSDSLNIFQGGGEMGALMRSYDWESHPLGNPSGWPHSLKSNVRLLLNSGFPMFIWWSKELYSFHNDAYLPALGTKHPSALGTPAREVWAEIWEEIGNIAHSIMNGGEPFYAEGLKLFLRRQGFAEETYWTFSYSPAFNDAGEVDGVFCACHEVTSTILGQRRLTTLREISDMMSQVQVLEEACQSICAILNQNQSDVPFSQIYLLNSSGTEARLLGASGVLAEKAVSVVPLTSEGAVGQWPLKRVYDSKQMQVVKHLEGAFAPSEGQLEQAQVKQAVILPILRPGHDQVLGFFVAGISEFLSYDIGYQNFHELIVGQVATTIASIESKEQAARQQQELLNLFQQAPVAICVLRGSNHVIELANPGICELWGKTLEDVLGKPVLEALPEVKDQGIKELLDSVFYTGVPYVNNELPVILERNGKMETVYFNFVYQPMRDRWGNITGIIAVAVGVNEQVEARHEIESMNTELRAINADLDNFVYSASHDLKAPISNIEGLMETLVEFLPKEIQQQDAVQEVLSMITASVGRFKRAVADLTEVAKIQREAGEDVASIDLAEVVEDVQLDFKNMIQASNAQITTTFAPDSTVKFSAKNVRSIVYNLFSNALKYRANDRTPTIEITTEHEPKYVVLTVADNGLGIRPEEQHKIFSMFKRLHDHVEGTGIGLYIVKRIIENAGGKIEVESQEGVGTTFKVYFKR